MKTDKRLTGHKQTEETKRKISESHKGSKNPMYGKVTKGAFKKGECSGSNNLNWKGGLPKCILCDRQLVARNAKYCLRHRPTSHGVNHYMYKHGKTPLRKLAERKVEYREWRIAIFERDNYVCQICKVRGGELQADHIKPWAYFPDLRLSIDNGRTLCVECHRKTDTYGVNGRRRYAYSVS